MLLLRHPLCWLSTYIALDATDPLSPDGLPLLALPAVASPQYKSSSESSFLSLDYKWWAHGEPWLKMVVDRLAMLGAGGGRPQDDSGLKSWWRHGLRHLLGYWHCPTPPLPQDEAVVACSQRCLSCLQGVWQNVQPLERYAHQPCCIPPT
ncbi:hypothetical protein PVAP13_9NG117500 [Panicum virgatum]|uniref:Uncharacterized protein n=1 Tax=Panicum virgatum TaxID=38727 RepID=A0A8T0MIX2_PANVG|nr:hypothetical protein PVAP13_9NG117500 [Panicum virgatum]